eukprot:3750012-Prymnesium_polylepis.1
MHWPSHCEAYYATSDNQIPAPEKVAVENNHEILRRRRPHPRLYYSLQLAAESREDMLPPGA